MTMRDLNLQPFELPAPHFDFFYDYMDKAQLTASNQASISHQHRFNHIREHIGSSRRNPDPLHAVLENLAAISSMKPRHPSTQDVSTPYLLHLNV